MRDFRLLLRLTVRNRWAALRAGSWRKENGKLDVNRLVATLIVALSMVTVAGFAIYAEVRLFALLKTFQQAALLPALAMLFCLASTLMLSFFQVFSGLYFSRDTQWMAYLPVRSRAVMGAKLVEIWFWEELVTAAVLLPVGILYGVHLNGGMLYYLRLAVATLLAPALPLCVITFLTTLLASVTSLAKHKEAVAMVFSLVMVTAVLAVENSFLPQIPDDAGAMYFVQLFLDNEGILTLLTSAFPPVLWWVHGLQGSWSEFLLFVGCCVGAVALPLAVLGGGYLNICLRQGEHATHKRRVRTTDKTWRQRTQLMALFHREWASVVKSPTIAFNSLYSIFLFPLILVMICVGGTSDMAAADFLVEIQKLTDVVHPLDAALIAAAAVGFASFMNPAVATAVTREGKRLDMSRMLPVCPGTQMTAKLMVGMLIDLLAVLLAAVILLVILPHLALSIVLGGVLALLMCFASSALSLTLDAVRPNLHWTNETQAIKQGANVAFGMLIGLAVFALPIVPPVLLLDATPLARFASAAGVLVAEAAVGLALLHFVGVKRFAALEPTA